MSESIIIEDTPVNFAKHGEDMLAGVIDSSFRPSCDPLTMVEEMRVADMAPRPQGYVTMLDCPVGKKPRIHHQGFNLCVHNSRQILANLMAYGHQDVSQYQITKAHFGNRGNSDDGVVVNPGPPEVTDIALEEPLINVEIVSGANFTVDNIQQRVGTDVWIITYKITFDLNTGHNPGGLGYKQYTEMGLFATNNLMYARKTFPSYIKTADRKLIVFWTIAF